MINYYLCTFSPLYIFLLLNLKKKKIVIGGEMPNEKNSKAQLNYLIVLGLVIAFFLGARLQYVGSGDGKFYYSHWRYICSTKITSLSGVLKSSSIENGYTFSVWLLSRVFKNGQWVFIFQGIFVAYSACRFVYKNSTSPCISLLTFMSLGLFNFMAQGIRQSIAMCICLFAIEEIKKRRFIRFLIVVAIAMTFHGSAIVFFPMYFVYGIKLDLKGLLLCTAGVVLLNYALPVLFKIVNFAINDSYSLSKDYRVNNGRITMLIYATILICGFAFRNVKNPSKEYDFFLIMSAMSLVAFILRFNSALIAERISLYYGFAQMIMIPKFLDNAKPKERLVISSAAIALMMALIVHKAGYSSLVPYELFWQ